MLISEAAVADGMACEEKQKYYADKKQFMYIVHVCMCLCAFFYKHGTKNYWNEKKTHTHINIAIKLQLNLVFLYTFLFCCYCYKWRLLLLLLFLLLYIIAIQVSGERKKKKYEKSLLYRLNEKKMGFSFFLFDAIFQMRYWFGSKSFVFKL